MSDSEEDSASTGKQKSIFSGMGRVKQINHLREKWSPKPKSPLPDRAFADTPPSSPWGRRPSRDKLPLSPQRDSGRHTLRRAQSVSGSPRRQSVVTVVDMERYLAINTWLEHNGINVAQVETSGVDSRRNSSDYGLFDDMYCSLEVLEHSVKKELSHLGINDKCSEDGRSAEASHVQLKDTSGVASPATCMFDYLAVIGADMLDVKIRNFWDQRESVFEATVAFAHPPESQFNAESLDHFCFPTGIQTINTTASTEQFNEPPDANASSKEGDFFVLMISGGGTQGQSVQYAMCMKEAITIRGGGDDGKNLLLPICYCIIAQIPFIPFFRAVLQGFLDNLRNELESRTGTGCSPLSNIVTDKHAGYIDDILQHLKTIPLPEKGLSVSVDVFPSPSPELTLTRPHKENDLDEKVALLLQWALPSLLSRLSVDRLLQILSLLLIETKLIVVSDEIPLLSSATLGLASLLHPLVWAGPLISILPPSMHEYMEAPVPLICGVDDLPRDFECSKGTCILHLVENRVQLHAEDERAIGRLQMPELDELSCDLTRFTKQMLGRVTGSFRDNVTPLSTHLVIHRVRRHIEHLVSVCAHAYRGHDTDHQLNVKELRFADIFMQTQMYQKYLDDQPVTTSIDPINQQPSAIPPPKDDVPIKTASINTQHDGLKSAASVLFQIALAGVSALPRSSSRVNMMSKRVADGEIEAPSLDMVALATMDEPELSSSAASIPSARIFSNMKSSPNDKLESPSRGGYELLSPTLSEASTHTERRPDRTFVWPLSQSELDVFWVSDEASVASPGSAQPLALHSPRSDTFESPRRSPNNESYATYVEDLKSVGRSEHGSVVNCQRADTETTISIFDTVLGEDLVSADTADDAWQFEPPDDPRPTSQHNDDSDEDRSTKHESSADDEAAPTRKEGFCSEAGTEHNNSPVNARRSWRLGMNDQGVVDTPENHGPKDSMLPAEQVEVLTTGVNMESRGAWEGWCQGNMCVSPDFTTLAWERRTVAFAALNMNIADITSIAFEDRQAASPGGLKQCRVRFTFSSEAIYFQFSSSLQHHVFFDALKQLVQPSQHHSAERQRSFPSLSSPVVAAPQIPSPTARNEQGHDATDHHEKAKTTNVTAIPSFLLAQVETDIDRFKRKLQRGFLVEKHGRLGKPHLKILFTDALCSYIMWRKPPATGSDDQHKQDRIDDQLYRRSSLFSNDKSIPVDSITAIVTGKQTTVFRRATANKSSDRACLSILTPTRTLDICANSLQGFQELYRGFSLLLEEIKRTRDGLD
ncbi:hypothetical protein PHYPSEUDO_012474 [Phytophthora pseudosyringae]|uniref:UDENN domain-containing protein n=1 Tax=Phytophthora pseudosyringae TaxID=221518 RepID=A0A8T1WL09_9STRA|nr:hypothetical protein PHYPSEUDO_012474 [Phytophthora pseudosyringae]